MGGGLSREAGVSSPSGLGFAVSSSSDGVSSVEAERAHWMGDGGVAGRWAGSASVEAELAQRMGDGGVAGHWAGLASADVSSQSGGVVASVGGGVSGLC